MIYWKRLLLGAMERKCKDGQLGKVYVCVRACVCMHVCAWGAVSDEPD